MGGVGWGGVEWGGMRWGKVLYSVRNDVKSLMHTSICLQDVYLFTIHVMVVVVIKLIGVHKYK